MPIPDIDSVADANDGDSLVDDEINGGSSGGDEDDHDTANLVIEPADSSVSESTSGGTSPTSIPRLAFTGTSLILPLVGTLLLGCGGIATTLQRRRRQTDGPAKNKN